MKVTTTDGHTLLFFRNGDPDHVFVAGTDESLDCFIDGVILAGTETVDGPENASERSTGLIPYSATASALEVPSWASDRVLRVSAGTVAIWLTFESLNYL